MRFKEYIEEKKIDPRDRLEKMSDKEILKFYSEHKKGNFHNLSGNIFTSLMDEIKLRKLTRKLTDKDLKNLMDIA
jgi:hypothetical protein